MVKNKTRRNKTEGGKRNKTEGGKRRNKTEGGKRRATRKMAKGASDWNKKVMEVYHDMKKKDPHVRLGAAMKRAAELKRKGEL
jgi:hypothetical protein